MTLTEFGQTVKKLIPFVILAFIIILIFFFGIRLLILVINNQGGGNVSLNPTPILHPLFGQISHPTLSEAVPSSRFSDYALDTFDGLTVSATASGNVYFLPQGKSNLTYRSRAFSMAQTIGFDTEKATYKDNREKEEVIFKDGKQTLIIDTRDFNFSYESKLTNKDPMLATKGLPQEENIIAKAVSFLESLNKYPTELAQGVPTVLYIQYDTVKKELAMVENPEDANMAEVDFRRPDELLGEESVPVVSPNYFNTQNYVVMIFSPDDVNKFKIVRARVNFFPKSEDQIGIYPLKDGAQAFKDLQEGRGYIVSFPHDDAERIYIKNMFVGYLNPEGYEPYLQPIYVFLGRDNFVAYVPAITDSFLTEPTKKEEKETETPSSSATESASQEEK